MNDKYYFADDFGNIIQELNEEELSELLANQQTSDSSLLCDKDALKEVSKEKIAFNKEYAYMLGKEVLSTDAILNKEATIELKKQITAMRNMSTTELDAIVARSTEALKSPEFVQMVNLNPQIKEVAYEQIEMLKNIADYTDDEIYESFVRLCELQLGTLSSNNPTAEIINATIFDDFYRFINDETNVYGQANAATREIYDENGVNYEKWINPSDDNNVQLEVAGKNVEIKM